MTDQTKTVASADGTSIAYDQTGEGPPVVLVCGGSVDHLANLPLPELLAPHFTVYNIHRRGRGDSGDTPPYAVAREVEDIAAVIGAAGGSACLWGSSSGAALALEAAASGLPVTKLALWEPPYFTGGRPKPPADTAKTYTDLVSAGRRGDAVEYFMAKVVGLPPEFVAGARSQPFWAAGEALAHTLAYDATVMGDYSLPVERAAAVTVPTLVLDGGASFPGMAQTAEQLTDALPHGQRRTLEGQQHNVDMNVLAVALVEFFAA
ncbi:MAG: alpha/beta fold hydrolase [Propionibacteriales bacterium]|nr:alpha/beta fold hydrolase [Propionibacteriales bacterium]